MAILRDWLPGTDYEVLSGSDRAEIYEIYTDSRTARPGGVFVAMKGTRSDSHVFLPELLKKGVTSFVVEEDMDELPECDYGGADIVRVSDSRKALSVIAAARYGHPADSLTLIGITGTKGKTSSSYMMKAILDGAGVSSGVIGTNGIEFGGHHIDSLNTTPDSLSLEKYFRAMADSGVRVVVMECSSQGFKMRRTEGLVFDYGIFLNISPDHIGPMEHESFGEYLDCKKMLMEQSRTAIVNIDDEKSPLFIETAERHGARVWTTGIRNEAADLSAIDIRHIPGEIFSGSRFLLRGLRDTEMALSIPGDCYIENALPVIVCALLMGIDTEKIRAALSDVSVDGRMETVFRSEKFACIVDYAHNPVSIENLCGILRSCHPGRIVLVFGCGGNRSKDRRTGMGEAAARNADFSVITTDNSRFEKPSDIMNDIYEAYLLAGGRKENAVLIEDRAEAIRYALRNARKGDIIAVIGKGHESYQEENGARRRFLDKEEILKAQKELGL